MLCSNEPSDESDPDFDDLCELTDEMEMMKQFCEERVQTLDRDKLISRIISYFRASSISP